MMKREGLPFKPGQKLPMDAANDIATAVPVESLKPSTKKELEADDRKYVKESIANVESAVAAPVVEAAKELDEQEKTSLRAIGMAKLSPEEREALGLLSDVRRCGRCGHDLSKRVIDDPSVEDKRAFLRSLPNGDRFMKSYPLFNGIANVWFRTRLTDESDEVIRQLHLDVDIHRNDPSLIQVRLTRLNLVCSLARIEWLDDDGEPNNIIDYPDVNTKNYKDDSGRTCVALADEKVLKPFNDSMYNAIFHVFMKFSVLTEMLMSRAEDSDFWAATK